MITLIGERLDGRAPGVRADVRFYFLEADGAMGVRSAWAIPPNPFKEIKRPHDFSGVHVGHPKHEPPSYEMVHEHLQAARRFRRIRRAILGLRPGVAGILWAAYADERPSLAREVLSDASPLAEHTNAARRLFQAQQLALAARGAEGWASMVSWLDSLCQRTARALRNGRPLPPEDWEALKAIRVEAEAHLRSADAMYSAEYQRGRREE